MGQSTPANAREGLILRVVLLAWWQATLTRAAGIFILYLTAW